MTPDSQANPEKRFVSIFLPWLIAAGGLALYLATLNHWVSLGNLLQVSRLSGWTWQPELYAPLFWLVSLPLRWVPVQNIPLALNLFSCLCACLTLALLARSVLLLPQDRTQEQRKRAGDNALTLSIRFFWLPPVFAAAICGLQLTFWESATAATSQALTNSSNEMLDLLLFAYVLRCLLEYRVESRESWLLRAAFVYGLGVTNNWAMIGFIPLFVAALVWIKGLSFFNLRFLTRMFFCGLAALSLYLLLPATQGIEHTVHVPFWPALKVNLMGQKNILAMLYKIGRHTVLLLSLASLVPVLIISIRWSSYFGDTSEIGVALAKFMFHLIHGLFFVVCLWVSLDPPFSPRNQGYGVGFLTFYYLGALSIGYFTGYFLLVFGQSPPGIRRSADLDKLVNAAVIAVLGLLVIAAPVLLVYRNWPQIKLTNGPLLKQYAILAGQNLPPHNAVLISDDDHRLSLMQSYAALTGRKDYIFLNTDSLKYPDYHRFLKRRYQGRWPGGMLASDFVTAIPASELITALRLLMLTNSVYYLHPSFGYYFEYFSAEPLGLVYKLVPYPATAMLAPPLPPAVQEENNKFWAEAEQTALHPLARTISPPPSGSSPKLMDTLLKKIHLEKPLNFTALTLGNYYSRALDNWGVALQKEGRLTNAAAFFTQAIDLNPDNIVAEVNLECNKNLQAGRRSTVQISKSVEDEFGKYRSWDSVITANGPFDEPGLCFEQGRVFVRNSMARQAVQQLDRARQLAPDDLDAYLWLAQLYVLNRLPDRALQLVEEIHTRPSLVIAAQTNRAQMLFVETSAHLGEGDVAGAQAVVQAALKKSPGDEALLSTATQVYMTFQSYSNALPIIDQQLSATPDNVAALFSKGFASIMMEAYEQAIPPLTRVLTLDTNNYSARLNRSIAYLRLKNFHAARNDYEILQKTHPTDYRVDFGLFEIAWQGKDTNAAIRYAELYLANANTNSAEAKSVMERLKSLKPGAP